MVDANRWESRCRGTDGGTKYVLCGGFDFSGGGPW